MYAFLRLIVRAALRIFYREFEVQGFEFVPRHVPLIIVSNHPNTFMDAMVIGAVMPRPVYFIANSGVFAKGWRNWLFTRLHMIPVQRKQDTGQGLSVNNEETFRKCHEHLGRGGTLLIFPEGSSVHERKLRDLKSGTARIALGAEQSHDWGLHVCLLPVGLNYASPRHFRSRLLVRIDAPVQARDYKDAWEKDPFQAVNQLTEELRRRMEEQVIHTRNAQEDELVELIEKIYRPVFFEGRKPGMQDQFLFTKNVVEAVQYFGRHEPEAMGALAAKLRDYFDLLDRLRIDERDLSADTARRRIWIESLKAFAFAVPGLPVYLCGLLLNYVPYRIPGYVAQAVTGEPEYHAPIMLVTGILTFTGWYAACWGLLGWQGPLWLLPVAMLLMPLTGLFALRYARFWSLMRGRWWLTTLFFRRKPLYGELIARRSHILSVLEEAKERYAAAS